MTTGGPTMAEQCEYMTTYFKAVRPDGTDLCLT